MRPLAIPFRAAGGFVLLAFASVMRASAADPIEEVGKSAAAWIDTRAETARIASAWTQDRELLTGTLNGLKERAQRLTEQRDKLLAITAEERAEQDTLAARLAASKQSLADVETRLVTLTERALQLRPSLPPRLSEALEMSYRSLAGKEGSPGERMQWLMTIINRCAQFNLGITQGDEVLALAGESGPKSVETIYWGLSHGYALDRVANKVWLGAPGANGWQWEPLDAAAARGVVELIAIRRDEAAPRLVTVPARLKTSSAP